MSQECLDHFIIGIPVKRGDKDKSVDAIIRAFLEDNTCMDCGKKLSASEVDFCKRNYDGIFCMNCQKKHKKKEDSG